MRHGGLLEAIGSAAVPVPTADGSGRPVRRPVAKVFETAAGLVYRADEALRSLDVSRAAEDDGPSLFNRTDTSRLCPRILMHCARGHSVGYLPNPCARFDVWRLLPVVTDDYEVLHAVRTYF